MRKKQPATPNLFGVTAKPSPARKPTTNGAVQRLIGLHISRYRDRFSEPPVITKRDGQMLKTLVLKFGEETVRERLTVYHAWEDRFAEESGYAIPTFYHSWSRHTAIVKRKDAVRPVPTAETTAEYLRKLRGQG